MLLYQQIKRTFGLLDPQNQKKLIALGVIQMILGFLDLFAILVVGLFSYVGSSYFGVSQIPESLKLILEKFGFPIDNLGRTLIYLISIAVTLMVTKSVLALLILKKTFHFLANRSAEISEKFGSKFMASSYKTITNQSSQEATYSIARGLHIGEILGGATVIISEITMLTLLSGFIIFADPILAATLLAYFVILFLLSQKKLGSWMRSNSTKFTNSTVSGDQAFQDGIALFKELYVANKLNVVIKQFATHRWEVANSTANMQLIGYIPKLTFESALIVGACLVGVQQVLMGSTQSAIATLVIFMAAGSRILPSLLRLQSATSSLQSVSGGTEIAFRLLNSLGAEQTPEDSDRKDKKLIDAKFDPKVDINDVNFSYENSSDFCISNLSLTIPSGGSLAIVGRTGSGKSTLADLILGILKPSTGTVEINGETPITSIKNWPGSIGYVPQIVAFINGSVRENVALGIEISDKSDERIWQCLEMAQLDSLFRGSVEGLETLIGERGVKLSGGQRQRLGIARALFTNPKLLVLDEATSALDSETEKAVSETIHKLAHKVTLIVIAHRIATVKELDQVIYLENGQITAKGTFEEVRAAVPDFERQSMLLGL